MNECNIMQKKDLVIIHRTLFLIKELFEKAGISNRSFEFYDERGVFPGHVHKTKQEHTQAILTLSKGILEFFESKPGTAVVIELLKGG